MKRNSRTTLDKQYSHTNTKITNMITENLRLSPPFEITSRTTVQQVASKKFCTQAPGFRTGLPRVWSEVVRFMRKLPCKYVFLSYFVTFKRVLHDHDLICDL